MTVVFPVHNGDIDLGIAHARWLNKLGRWESDAVVLHDPTLNRDTRNVFVETLKRSFPRLRTHVHKVPPAGGWPMAPNFVWQQAARHMQDIGSWLWMEADAIALTPDWVQRIESSYLHSGKPFMGPVVKDMLHVNGVSVYPPKTPSLIPTAMAARDMAWDYVAKAEMAPKTHDASDLMQHLWSVERGLWLECGGGQVPMLLTEDDLRRNLKPSAVMLHRVKDTSVIKLLMGGFKL